MPAGPLAPLEHAGLKVGMAWRLTGKQPPPPYRLAGFNDWRNDVTLVLGRARHLRRDRPVHRLGAVSHPRY
jgi:hypothetical protein